MLSLGDGACFAARSAGQQTPARRKPAVPTADRSLLNMHTRDLLRAQTHVLVLVLIVACLAVPILLLLPTPFAGPAATRPAFPLASAREKDLPTSTSAPNSLILPDVQCIWFVHRYCVIYPLGCLV